VDIVKVVLKAFDVSDCTMLHLVMADCKARYIIRRCSILSGLYYNLTLSFSLSLSDNAFLLDKNIKNIKTPSFLSVRHIVDIRRVWWKGQKVSG
jgi:hypothetical protein